ncbi:MAG: hypothetical protein QW561_02530 [Candidatus Aenigmatarchaeota archaeon]
MNKILQAWEEANGKERYEAMKELVERYSHLVYELLNEKQKKFKLKRKKEDKCYR